MLKLIIGNKSTSSWSMRPWLVLSHSRLYFTEIEIDQRSETFKTDVAPYSPTKKVPVLHDGELVIWDSLAIAEYLAEKVPTLWPSDPLKRAIARSITAEIHSGFLPLRRGLPMDLKSTGLPYETTDDIERDIARISTICQQATGTYLFGDWTIADAFLTPVATRFITYGVALPKTTQTYFHNLLTTPEAKTWINQARKGLEKPFLLS